MQRPSFVIRYHQSSLFGTQFYRVSLVEGDKVLIKQQDDPQDYCPMEDALGTKADGRRLPRYYLWLFLVAISLNQEIRR
jgi:hypothetical protein